MQQTNPIFHILLSSLSVCVLFLSSCHHLDTDPVEALPFRNDGTTWGVIATDGTVLQPAGSFEHRPSAVVGGMFSLANEEGRLQLYSLHDPAHPVSQRSFVRIGHFFENVTLAQEETDSPILLIDKQGNNVASTAQYPQYDIVLMHNFSEGRALFATGNGKYGYMDTQGNIVIPPIYDRAYDFHEGLALAGNTNSQGQSGYLLIDRNGKIKTAIRLSNSLLDAGLSDSRLLFCELGTRHFGYLNRQGEPELYLPEKFRLALPYKNDMAVVETEEGQGVIDRQGQPLIPSIYDKIHLTNHGLTAICKNGKWAVVDPRNQAAIQFQYDSIGHYYNEGLAVARQKGEYLLIDKEGNPQGNVTYNVIGEEQTASRLCPQRFLIERPSAGNSMKLQSESIEDKQGNALPDTDLAQASGTHTTEPTTKTSSHIASQDWRKVSEQHPFYQEAIKVVSGKLDEKDAGNRQMILNYVEHLRTSYTTKDIDFLEQLFSENALIVVGTVVHTSQKETGYLSPAQVVYNVKSKRQYLDRLKQVFKANRSIDVKFSDFHIMRHPTVKGIYGVSLRQKYRSDIYADDGYLFLLWDFRDETAPKIHVRTWQPRMQADHTPLPENEIFNINNFNLQ